MNKEMMSIVAISVMLIIMAGESEIVSYTCIMHYDPLGIDKAKNLDTIIFTKEISEL